MRLVPVAYLKKNSIIAVNIIDSRGRLMLKAGQKITDNGIDILNRLGIVYVYITDEHCLNNNQNQYTAELASIYDCIIGLNNIAQRIVSGESGAVDIKNATEIASKIVDDILLLPENFKISYEPTKLAENKIIEQNIYVAIMSIVLGAKMKYSKEDLVKLCLAALLKDVALISPKINWGDINSYKKHPAIAYQYLKETYNIDEKILKAVLQHHERCDGSGFPNKTRGDEICDFAKIIGMIDCFYEIKSNHDVLNNSPGLLESKLASILQAFDYVILQYFIANAEVFSLDTLVRLNNDSIGVVVKNGEVNPFKPVVKILKGKPHDVGKVVDLDMNKQLAIKNIEYYIED